VKGTVSSLDQRYRVSLTVTSTYELARQQALELDARYGISQRVQGVAASVVATASQVRGTVVQVGGTVAAHAQSGLAQAQTVAARALEHPHVAAAAQRTSDFYQRAREAVGGLVEQAKTDVRNIETRFKASAMASNATAPPAVPPSPADAEGARASEGGVVVEEGALDLSGEVAPGQSPAK